MQITNQTSNIYDINISNNLALYTVNEVANLLKVKKSYVYELIYTNQLKSIRLSERRIRIPYIALQDFIMKETGCLTENIYMSSPKEGKSIGKH